VVNKVVINRRAYEDMVIYASRYASEEIDKDEQKEVYGILVGSVDEPTATVFVNQAIGIVVGERTGVEFEAKEYVDLSNIDETVWKRSVEYKRGDFICGWWHTHPGFGFFYSQTDIMNHIGFQTTNPFAIGVIYDYTQMKFELEDPGIEILTLEEPHQASPFNFVKFEIQEKGHALDYLKRDLRPQMKKIQDIQKRIKRIEHELEKKQFAQVQRNYGLLLLEKETKKKSKKALDAMKEEDRWLYEWNEETIKKSYKIPSFRKKIESLIEKSKNQKETRGKAQLELEAMLEKPKDKIGDIYKRFKQELEAIKPYRRWLGAQERLTLARFNNRITQYIHIINALISKSYHLLPHMGTLEDQLFDESILDKVFYGEEQEIEDLEAQLRRNIEEAAKMESKKKPIIMIADPELDDIDRQIQDQQEILSYKQDQPERLGSGTSLTAIIQTATLDPTNITAKPFKKPTPKPLPIQTTSEPPQIISNAIINNVDQVDISNTLNSITEPVEVETVPEGAVRTLSKEEKLERRAKNRNRANGSLKINFNNTQPTQIKFNLEPIEIEKTESAFQLDFEDIFESEKANLHPPKHYKDDKPE
jgi:proteasome lid subunit RPN8/RPN11